LSWGGAYDEGRGQRLNVRASLNQKDRWHRNRYWPDRRNNLLYDKTHFLLDRGSLLGLAKALSVSDLEQLLESDTVQLSYMTSSLGVLSAGSPRTHQFVEFFIGDKDKKKKKLSVPEEIDFVLRREFKDSSQATALRKLFLRHVKANRSPRDDVPKLTRDDVADADYLVRSVRAILSRLVPEYSPPAALEFSIYDTGQGYNVITNLDYIRINELYHQRVPVQHSSITSEYFLSFLQDARADTYFAAHYLAEIVTLPILSDLIRLKHFEFLRPRERNETQLELFKDLAIGDFPSIREVINLACCRFRRHRVRCHDGTGGVSWRDGSLPASSSLRLFG
jgi:hypothetical protein